MSLSNLNATRIIDPVTGKKAFWSRQKKLCCMVAGMVGIVFLLSIIFALVGLSFVVKPLTTVRDICLYLIAKQLMPVILCLGATSRQIHRVQAS